MASTVSLAHAAVDKALETAYEKKWEESISHYKKAAELYRKAMTETDEREVQISLQQMAEEQDRKVKEYTALFNVALQHNTSTSSPINIRSSSSSSYSPSSSSSSSSSSSPSSSSPVSWGGGGEEIPSSSSPFATSPISLWGGVNHILDGIFGSSYLGGSPSSSPSSSPTHLEFDMGKKEIIEDDFVMVGSSSAPLMPHYPIPTASTIFSGPTDLPAPKGDPLPSLSEDFDENDDEYLETLDREVLIQEVKRLKGQVGNLMTLLSEQQEVKEENDVLKKSIIQFRKEVQKNISADRPRHQSAVWHQKEQEEVVSLTESLLSLPKGGGGRASSSKTLSGDSQQEKLQREKEALLQMAIQKREGETKRKEKRTMR